MVAALISIVQMNQLFTVRECRSNDGGGARWGAKQEEAAPPGAAGVTSRCSIEI